MQPLAANQIDCHWGIFSNFEWAEKLNEFITSVPGLVFIAGKKPHLSPPHFYSVYVCVCVRVIVYKYDRPGYNDQHRLFCKYKYSMPIRSRLAIFNQPHMIHFVVCSNGQIYYAKKKRSLFCMLLLILFDCRAALLHLFIFWIKHLDLTIQFQVWKYGCVCTVPFSPFVEWNELMNCLISISF